MDKFKFKNYGDVNPIDHGGIFIKQDSDLPEARVYYVVRINKIEDEENKWLLEDIYLDLEDLDDEEYLELLSFTGEKTFKTSEDLIQAIISYSIDSSTVMSYISDIFNSEKELIEDLKEYDIFID